MTILRTSFPYYCSMFIAGFSLMTIEIVSSRVVAPIIGSSVFTWTAVIGVTLLGLSLGSVLGGVLADRYVKVHGQRVLAVAFLIAAVCTYCIVPMSRQVDFIVDAPFSILTLSVVVSMVLFLLPSVAIGTLSPIVFKLSVDDVMGIGKTYGLLSSIWSLGSIVGVFMTGFYFIATIGSSQTVCVISLLLLALFYFFYLASVDRRASSYVHHVGVVVGVTFATALVIMAHRVIDRQDSSHILFQKESAYYDIRVADYDLLPEYGDNRILLLDIDSHSIQTEKPTRLFYTDMSPAFAAFSNTLHDVYVIGAGAYTLPMHLREYYPNARITVSELDPEIEKVGQRYFGLDTQAIKTDIGDARTQIAARNMPERKYDLIFGDAYNSFVSVPWYLLTKEFISESRNTLNQDGIFAINVIGTLEGPHAAFFKSVYSTFTSVFPNSYVFAFGSDTHHIQNITFLGVNNDVAIDLGTLRKKLDAIDKTRFLSSRVVDTSTLATQGMIITDDFAPVEHMMIGIIKEYFRKYLSVYRQIVG